MDMLDQNQQNPIKIGKKLYTWCKTLFE